MEFLQALIRLSGKEYNSGRFHDKNKNDLTQFISSIILLKKLSLSC